MHKISNINKEKKTGNCSKCGEIKIRIKFRKNGKIRGDCWNTIVEQREKYSSSPKRKIAALKSKGCFAKEQDIIAFNNATHCESCRDKRSKNKNFFHFDHCHKTGKPRGFLCQNCNLGLGFFKDSIERLRKAISYLETKKAQTK